MKNKQIIVDKSTIQNYSLAVDENNAIDFCYSFEDILDDVFEDIMHNSNNAKIISFDVKFINDFAFHTNIYNSDVNYPLNLYVYAKNKMNNSNFTLNKTTIEVLETVIKIKNKSENRIWNQQFLQYFKHDYSEFYKYCLNRDSWTISYKNFSQFSEEKELEAVEILNNMKKPYIE